MKFQMHLIYNTALTLAINGYNALIVELLVLNKNIDVNQKYYYKIQKYCFNSILNLII